jgi:hypothetical protein
MIDLLSKNSRKSASYEKHFTSTEIMREFGHVSLKMDE